MSAPAVRGSLEQRLESVRDRMTRACERAGRPASSVTLIAVSKTWPAEAVVAAMRAGVTDFGENRVQEALPKQAAVRGLAREAGLPQPAWHLVGHLQTNKARVAAAAFAILHAIDSDRLLEALAQGQAAGRGPVDIMIEVNVAGEATKFGALTGEVHALVSAARATSAVRLLGLMTVAPRVDTPEQARPVFRELRRLADAESLQCLSMGMTDDFEVAIEEGATHIRVGRALFGERDA
jgi:hypothetical protein